MERAVERNRERMRGRSTSCWFTHQMASKARADLPEARNTELSLGLPRAMLLSQAIKLRAGLEVQQLELEWVPIWDGGTTSRGLVYCITVQCHPLPQNILIVAVLDYVSINISSLSDSCFTEKTPTTCIYTQQFCIFIFHFKFTNGNNFIGCS